MALEQTNVANRILRALSPADFAELQPHFSFVEFPIRQRLELPNCVIKHVYFLESGLASLVVSSGAGQSVEVGIIGSDGVTGLPILLGTDRGNHETFIQTSGIGLRVSAEALRAALERSCSLRNRLLRYAQVLMTQIAFTALANTRFRIEERMARWLLMADDRTTGNTIRLTHEALAVMLGARRAGVTVALNHFQGRGIIEMKRGAINIIERSALEEAANGVYGAPEPEYRRLYCEA